jgi:hypothetical protein
VQLSDLFETVEDQVETELELVGVVVARLHKQR